MSVYTVPASELASRITIRVKIAGLRAWKVRLWLGLKVIALGVWLTGCNAEIDA